MQRRNLLSCVLVALVVGVLTSQVSAQEICSPACVQVANVYAPTTVAVGQPLTVTVTVSYSVNVLAGQGLIIAILDHAENGKLFHTTAITPGSCLSPSPESICFPSTSPGNNQGDYTASFTLTAPNQAGTWNLYVFGMVSQLSLGSPDYKVVSTNFKIVPIEVTTP